MYLIDTNILIYYFNGSIPNESYAKIDKILISEFNISVITKMEFLGFKKHTQESFEKAKLFIENAKVMGLDNNLIDEVINIRRQYTIKLPDAIIAATAIRHDLILVTRNEEDFHNIDLTIYNPFSVNGI